MDDIDPRIETGSVFRQAELRAEGLVGFVRMMVAISLGMFLAVTIIWSRGEVQTVLLRQWVYAVATVLGYFALGLFAWYCVRRGTFRHWMAWPLATGDCLFILFSIALGLQNAGLPGSFGFVFPAIWLVPLVLSFGALRFDPLMPFFVAGVLICGIAGIELYLDAPEGPVNINMVDLFLGGPPTVVRLAMLGMACSIMALAAFRARRLLLRALSEQNRIGNLVRYLPRQLAPRLAEGGLEELREGSRQEMAILFVDMRGFTTLSENLAPRDLSDLVTDYRACITRAAHGTGGMIDKFMGDAALVVFPDVDGSGKAALACLTCAERLVWEIDGWNAKVKSEIRAGIGLHWGSVFCGVVGDSERLEYSVFGDAVNTAARLEELTKYEDVQIIASRSLLDRAGLPADPTGWQVLSHKTLRGRSGEIEIFGCSIFDRTLTNA